MAGASSAAAVLRPSAGGLELGGSFIFHRSRRTVSSDRTIQYHGGPFIAAGDAYRFDFHLLASHEIRRAVRGAPRVPSAAGSPLRRPSCGDRGARGFTVPHGHGRSGHRAALADPAPARVCGASHGGVRNLLDSRAYRALFRAAVAEAAVVNLATAYYLSDAPDIFSRDLREASRTRYRMLYRSRSPLTLRATVAAQPHATHPRRAGLPLSDCGSRAVPSSSAGRGLRL